MRAARQIWKYTIEYDNIKSFVENPKSDIGNPKKTSISGECYGTQEDALGELPTERN
jgi:hypothetical protein